MFKKNDPLVQSVQKVMMENERRRQVEAKLCEELGIYSRKELPHEHQKNYDALLEQRINEGKKVFKSGDNVSIHMPGYAAHGQKGKIVGTEGEGRYKVHVGGATGTNTKMRLGGGIFGPKGSEISGLKAKSGGTHTVVPHSALRSIDEGLHPNQQKLDVHEPERDKLTAKDFDMLRAKKTMKKEEQLDEISDKLKSSYIRKADKQVTGTDAGLVKKDGGLKTKGVSPEDFARKYKNRKAGIKQAMKEEEQLDEISARLAGRAAEIARSRASDAGDKGQNVLARAYDKQAYRLRKQADKKAEKEDKEREFAAISSGKRAKMTKSELKKLSEEEGEETREGGAVVDTKTNKPVVSSTASKAEGPSSAERAALTNKIKQIQEKSMISRIALGKKGRKKIDRIADKMSDRPGNWDFRKSDFSDKGKETLKNRLKKVKGASDYALRKEDEEVEMKEAMLSGPETGPRKTPGSNQMNESGEMGPDKKKVKTNTYRHKTSEKEIVTSKDPGPEWELVKKEKKEELSEKAPPGAKFERMVKHIKKGYEKGGLTDKEKSIAYATAWKTKNKEEMKEGLTLDSVMEEIKKKFGDKKMKELEEDSEEDRVADAAATKEKQASQEKSDLGAFRASATGALDPTPVAQRSPGFSTTDTQGSERSVGAGNVPHAQSMMGAKAPEEKPEGQRPLPPPSMSAKEIEGEINKAGGVKPKTTPEAPAAAKRAPAPAAPAAAVARAPAQARTPAPAAAKPATPAAKPATAAPSAPAAPARANPWNAYNQSMSGEGGGSAAEFARADRASRPGAVSAPRPAGRALPGRAMPGRAAPGRLRESLESTIRNMIKD